MRLMAASSGDRCGPHASDESSSSTVTSTAKSFSRISFVCFFSCWVIIVFAEITDQYSVFCKFVIAVVGYAKLTGIDKLTNLPKR